jgi:MHS family shikimate/dehydroshikimate transporter-like MFS transporter
MVAGGAIGTLMEYYDYYLYGLAAATVFPTVFFPNQNVAVGSMEAFATFAFGFLLRPIGGIVFGHIGDRRGRKAALMITVIGMGVSTAAIGLIPSTATIGVAAPILLLVFRMLLGLFVGGEMGSAASLVVEHAPVGRRGLFGALLISGAGIANVASAGFMAAVASSHSFFITWGWRIPFVFALVLTIVAVVLRSKLEESEEFKEHTATIQLTQAKRKFPLKEVFRHPKNAILGILIGLPQSIAGYLVLTFGVAYMVSKGTAAQVGFIGAMIVGVLQIFAAPLWGASPIRSVVARPTSGAALPSPSCSTRPSRSTVRISRCSSGSA